MASVRSAVVVVSLVAAVALGFTRCKKEEPSTSTAPSAEVEAESKVRIDHGDEFKTAFPYYNETFTELGLNPEKLKDEPLVRTQDLAGALTFLGYGDVAPADFENVRSPELMKRFPNKTVLSAMYFAPKIVDVSVTPLNLGWRKVIRIKPIKDSGADKLGIDAAYLLFNKFQGEGDFVTDPMTKESQNTQMILSRGPSSSLSRTVYFLVYGPISAGGKLQTFLNASFDVQAPNIEAGSVTKYYVPNACSECHGGSKKPTDDDWKKIKVNYLDTDHWFDRIADGDDFPMLQTAPFGVLYDGGKDESTPQFKDAFDVIRDINTEIEVQNTRVEPAPVKPGDDPSFQLRAVRKWVELHKADRTHQDYFARALPSSTGPIWQKGVSPDKDLLPMMNRYCYRCHSSLKYNVFDRPALVKLKNTNKFPQYLRKPAPPFKMPQDRVLPDETILKFEALSKDFQ